jgi:hypothetical protein
MGEPAGKTSFTCNHYVKAFKPALILTPIVIVTVRFLPAMQTAFANDTSQLTIISSLEDGSEIERRFTEVVQNGDRIESGFPPATFTLVNGEKYMTDVADYDDYFFDYWLTCASWQKRI